MLRQQRHGIFLELSPESGVDLVLYISPGIIVPIRWFTYHFNVSTKYLYCFQCSTSCCLKQQQSLDLHFCTSSVMLLSMCLASTFRMLSMNVPQYVTATRVWYFIYNQYTTTVVEPYYKVRSNNSDSCLVDFRALHSFFAYNFPICCPIWTWTFE